MLWSSVQSSESLANTWYNNHPLFPGFGRLEVLYIFSSVNLDNRSGLKFCLIWIQLLGGGLIQHGTTIKTFSPLILDFILKLSALEMTHSLTLKHSPQI